MIGPEEFDQIISQIVAACPLLKKGFVVVDDAHLRRKIKDFKKDDSPFLAAGLPTIDITGQKDANIPYQVMVFFILKKVDYNDRKDAQEIPDYQECFLAAKQLNEYLKESSPCSLFANYDGKGIWDPEFNREGCDGYSLSLKLKDRA